ncbi:phosphotransferase family protein [Idiomarina sp. PL1-037]|uniref:phosphotransferase family protein n=1 Tax=unclassified Idiomarina TaxID=2614829 RepID=UPI00294B033D|nr:MULTISPECIES: phosphotransferase family protein [unclassified Idiomarina]MDV6327130.1 phosphotransferase family protein [Idiomarina sp. Sol25]WQC51978.1 phosphotransferase family protein [Idiomarina sp. PL1-037]
MTDPSSAVVDQASDVREEETLPVEALDNWLAEHIGDELPEDRGTLRITQYTGGVSNWTYRLDYNGLALVLRRPPDGTKAKSAHDMGREFRLQKRLRPEFPHVPRMLAYCRDESVIGAEFYVMEHVTGIIPRRRFPKGLELSSEQARQLCTNALDKLIKLHQVDLDSTGLRKIAKGKGYTERQVNGWCGRYEKAKTWNVFGAGSVMRWLKENQPPSEKICLVHNDFRLDNLILNPDDPTDIIGILDWELATLGNPLMDLGNSLAYWIEAGDDKVARATKRQPSDYPGMLTRKEIIDYYCERTGTKVEDFAFYEVFGLFRLAVIAQQIYYRYHHKQTTNKAFKNFWFLVNYLLWRCRRRIAKA